MDMRTTDTLPLPDTPVTVLLVSAGHTDRISLEQIMAHSGWRLQVRTTMRDGLELLRLRSVPLVICEASINWRSLLSAMAALPAPPKLIVCSRLADERLWAEVLNLGGYDVLSTPFDASEVLRACFLAWQAARSTEEICQTAGAGRRQRVV